MYMCSIPHEEIPATNVSLVHHSVPSNVALSRFLVALPSLNLLQISVHFIAKNTAKMLNDWHTKYRNFAH